MHLTIEETIALSDVSGFRRGDMKEVVRRGPKNGYLSAEKDNYRHKVWKELIKNGVDDGYYICLPSREGLEIDVMVNIGIKPEKIIAIDESAALLAMAKWRKKYPEVKCYGNKLSRASERITKDGLKISAANIDLCNNISAELVDELTAYYNNIKCERTAITISRGRESTLLNLLVKKYCKNYGVDARVGALIGLIESLNQDKFYSMKVEHCETYINNKVPMLWVVLETIIKGHEFILTNDIKEKVDSLEYLGVLYEKLLDDAYALKLAFTTSVFCKNKYATYKDKMYELDLQYTQCGKDIILGMDKLYSMCVEQSHICRLKNVIMPYELFNKLGKTNPLEIVNCGRKRIITLM